MEESRHEDVFDDGMDSILSGVLDEQEESPEVQTPDDVDNATSFPTPLRNDGIGSTSQLIQIQTSVVKWFDVGSVPQVPNQHEIEQLIRLFKLLFHANKCQSKKSKMNGGHQPCAVSNCTLMKSTLNHIKSCQSDNTCQIAYCVSSRQLLAHVKYCSVNECELCSQVDKVNSQAAVSVQSNETEVMPTVAPTSLMPPSFSPSKASPPETLVMLDLEATGLPAFEYKTRITEFAFIAISRKEFLKPPPARVTSVFSLCLNPQKQISPNSTKITGLDNWNLEDQPAFNQEIGQKILSYLEMFPQPVCLVAHNGNTFDFKLLLAELRNSKVCISDDILCADTLKAFRAIDKEAQKKKEEEVENEEPPPLEPAFQSTSTNNSIPSTPPQKIKTFSTPEERGEVTPRKSKKMDIPHTPPRLERRKKHPEDPHTPTSHPEIKSRKSLVYGEAHAKQPKLTYKLGDVYERITGHPPARAHTALDDCYTMLHVCQSYGQTFLNWVDENCSSFVDRQPSW